MLDEYKKYLVHGLGLDSEKEIETVSFGDTDNMADELGQLVLEGIKTGTSSGFDLYGELEEKPFVGQIAIVVNSQNEPLCVIKNIVVEIVAFKDVTAEHALKEGEGDKSLSFWRQAHLDFFPKYYETELGIPFTEDTLLLFEEFVVIDRWTK